MRKRQVIFVIIALLSLVLLLYKPGVVLNLQNSLNKDSSPPELRQFSPESKYVNYTPIIITVVLYDEDEVSEDSTLYINDIAIEDANYVFSSGDTLLQISYTYSPAPYQAIQISLFAIDKVGNSKWYNWTIISDRIPPSQPSVIASSTNYGVLLEWENKDEDIDYWLIYRGDVVTFKPSAENLIGIAKDPNFLDTQVIPGERYYYIVRGVDKAGNVGLYSRVVSITFEPQIVPLFYLYKYRFYIAIGVAVLTIIAIAIKLSKRRSPKASLSKKERNMLRGLIVSDKQGLALFAYSFKEKPLESQLVTGLITAVRTIGVSLGGGEELNEIAYQNMVLSQYNGKKIFTILITDDYPTLRLKRKLELFTKMFETMFEKQLSEWSGDSTVFSQANYLVKDIFLR